MTKTVLFIVADESKNAGERDYMKALAAQIKGNELQDTEYLVYKLPVKGQSTVAENANDLSGNNKILPLTDAEYATIPRLNDETISLLAQTEDLEIIGVGNSTLEALCTAIAFANPDQNNRRVRASYITHMVNSKNSLKLINTMGIKLFTSAKFRTLEAMDSILAKNVDYIQLDAVPNLNSPAHSPETHYDTFMKTGNGAKMTKILDKNEDFAFVVVNAGFGVGEAKIHVPYTKKEARIDARSLSRILGKRTHLILAHGGPRNLTDENKYNQKTLYHFMKTYLKHQNQYGKPPEVMIERFTKGLSYDAVKAGLVLGQKPNCKAFISNSEGYGTMEGAIAYINNQEKLLGMFPFKSNNADPTGQRLENIEDYNEDGVAKIMFVNGQTIVQKHPHERITPYLRKDAAQFIVETLGLAKPTHVSGPAQKPEQYKL